MQIDIRFSPVGTMFHCFLFCNAHDFHYICSIFCKKYEGKHRLKTLKTTLK